MIANLRNYEPETIEFVVPDSIREKFPPVLFQGSTNVDELIKLVNEVPKRERELLEAIERAKKIKSDAQDRLAFY